MFRVMIQREILNSLMMTLSKKVDAISEMGHLVRSKRRIRWKS